MAIERFLNEEAWNRLMQLIDDLGAVDLDELTARMDTIEGTVNAAVATANAASQQAQNAANTATAMGNRVTDLETLTTSQGLSIRTLQAVSDDHTEDIATLNGKTASHENNYTVNGITFRFRKFGSLVVVTSAGAPTTPIPTDGYMTSVAVDNFYKPTMDTIINVTATTTQSCQFYLGTNGNLTLGFANTAISNNVRINAAYYTTN